MGKGTEGFTCAVGAAVVTDKRLDFEGSFFLQGAYFVEEPGEGSFLVEGGKKNKEGWWTHL